MAPGITILTVNYNGSAFLERALRSALLQDMTREAYEILVADDGSTDDSRRVIEDYKSEVRALYLRHCGLPMACNEGIKAAKGKYLIRLDADDELEPSALSEAAAVLDRQSDVAMVLADRWEIDEATKQTGVVRIDPQNVYSYIAPGVMFRREALFDLGLYDALYWEEFDLFIRFLQKYLAHYIAFPLYRYYRHPHSMTANAKEREKGWEELIKKWGIECLRRSGYCKELEEVYAAISR